MFKHNLQGKKLYMVYLGSNISFMQLWLKIKGSLPKIFLFNFLMIQIFFLVSRENLNLKCPISPECFHLLYAITKESFVDSQAFVYSSVLCFLDGFQVSILCTSVAVMLVFFQISHLHTSVGSIMSLIYHFFLF